MMICFFYLFDFGIYFIEKDVFLIFCIFIFILIVVFNFNVVVLSIIFFIFIFVNNFDGVSIRLQGYSNWGIVFKRFKYVKFIRVGDIIDRVNIYCDWFGCIGFGKYLGFRIFILCSSFGS